MSQRAVLVVDDDALLGMSIQATLEQAGLAVRCAQTIAAARALIAERSFDVVVLDQHLPDGNGLELCPELVRANEQTKIVFITAYPSYEHAVNAIRAGAWDYLSKPFELAALTRAVTRALGTLRLERVEKLSALQAHPAVDPAAVERESGLDAVWRLVQAAAPTDAPVLLTGETGTGKNRIARAIHAGSARRGGPWVTVNCAAVPDHLIEAELFGWERGAFTGATGAREGLLELAEGGTLLLDEIGEMPAALQTKLLSVLEDREVRRVGGRSTRSIDVRIIAATNADLDARVRAGQFRADLFYRLNVVRIELPPLRARLGDLPVICEDLLTRLSQGLAHPTLAAGELARLAEYSWPGNVRELRNVLERSLILHRGALRPSELLSASPAPAAPRALPVSAELTLEQMERQMMERALARHGGNLTAAARALGVSLSTLKRRLKTFGLDRASLTERVNLSRSA